MFGVLKLRHNVLLYFFVSSTAGLGKANMLVTHTTRIGR